MNDDSSSSQSFGLDDVPVRRFHWLLSSIGAMGVLIDGYDLSVIAFSVLLISSEFHFTAKSSPLLYGLVLASALIGMAIGGVSFGWLADKLGRKTAFVIDLLFFIVFALLSSIAQDVYQVIIFRLLMGIGIGADYPISSTLISEFAPAKKRGSLLMYGIMFYWVGTFLAGAANYFSLGLGLDVSWRVALAFGGLLAIPIVILRNFVPESPRWLIQKKKYAEANKIAESRIGTSIAADLGRFPHSKKEIFTRYYRSTFFVLATWFAFSLAAYGLGFYTSTLYQLLGVKSLSQIALFGMLTAPFPILAYFILMRYIVDKHGRKIPTAIGFGVMTVVLAVLPPLITRNAYLLLPLFITFSSLEQWPGGILSFGYSVELFPTSLRGLGQGLATTVSRIGAVIGVLFFLLIASTAGLLYGSLFFLAFTLSGLLLTIFFAPETKQLTLEQITEGKAAEAETTS
ncbi:MAG: MFS transporter [archaeon]|nr:MFS transporter [archaeon]